MATIEEIIEFLSKKQHGPPTHAPLLEYVEYIRCECNTLSMPNRQVILNDLEAWTTKVASRLGMDMQNIRTRIHQKKPSAHIEKSAEVLIILLTVEPANLVSKKEFNISTWLYRLSGWMNHDKAPLPQKIKHRTKRSLSVPHQAHRLNYVLRR